MVKSLICDNMPCGVRGEKIVGVPERMTIMREWPYAKEPFDTKLFILRFLRKLWMVILAAVLGALLVGGGYYLKKVVFGGPVEYDITTTYYVEYNQFDPVTGEMFNYTNAATWKNWVVSDWFVDKAWEHALEAGLMPETYGVDKSALKGYFTADLPSDLRIPTSTVTTPYEGLTEALNDALQQTFIDFAAEQSEMDGIKITDETPLAVADKDIRTLRAVILGAVFSAFLAGFGLAFAIILDDSIVIPETFTYRYGVPALGYWGREKQQAIMRGEWKPEEEVLAHLQYLFDPKGKNALVSVGKNLDKPMQEALLPFGFGEVQNASALNAESYEKIREADKILLLVEAEAKNAKRIEYVLHELNIQNCTVAGALLCQANAKLINAYRFGKAGKSGFQIKEGYRE